MIVLHGSSALSGACSERSPPAAGASSGASGQVFQEGHDPAAFAGVVCAAFDPFPADQFRGQADLAEHVGRTVSLEQLS